MLIVKFNVTQAKDKDVREYLETFLALYANQPSMKHLNSDLIRSDIHQRMISERNDFCADVNT